MKNNAMITNNKKVKENIDMELSLYKYDKLYTIDSVIQEFFLDGFVCVDTKTIAAYMNKKNISRASYDDDDRWSMIFTLKDNIKNQNDFFEMVDFMENYGLLEGNVRRFFQEEDLYEYFIKNEIVTVRTKAKVKDKDKDYEIDRRFLYEVYDIKTLIMASFQLNKMVAPMMLKKANRKKEGLGISYTDVLETNKWLGITKDRLFDELMSNIKKTWVDKLFSNNLNRALFTQIKKSLKDIRDELYNVIRLSEVLEYKTSKDAPFSEIVLGEAKILKILASSETVLYVIGDDNEYYYAFEKEHRNKGIRIIPICDTKEYKEEKIEKEITLDDVWSNELPLLNSRFPKVNNDVHTLSILSVLPQEEIYNKYYELICISKDIFDDFVSKIYQLCYSNLEDGSYIMGLKDVFKELSGKYDDRILACLNDEKFE